MSLTFINNFQHHVHSTISNNREIMSVIKKIYFNPVQDGKCPFLIINIKKADDLSRYNAFIYSIDFQILVYAKDQNHRLLAKLADKIVKLLSNNNQDFNRFSTYEIQGIKAGNVEFDRAQDLVINKLTINYKALISRGNIDELS